MANTAPITVLLLNYNQSKYFEKSWNSLLSQNLKPEQVLVIDDGSSGNDVEVLAKFVHDKDFSQVTFIHDNINRGHTARMNQALDLATGEFFMLLSADDWLEPNALFELTQAARPDVDVVWGNISVVNENGSSRGYVRPRQNWQGPTASKYVDGGKVFHDILKVNSFITGGMSILRRATILKVGGWDPNVTTEDLDMWLRMGRNSNFVYIDSVVGNYRQVPGSKSRKDEHKLIDQAKIFRKHVGEDKYIDRNLAYLAAMRWALAVARTKRVPKISLYAMANLMNLRWWKLYIQLPRAIFNPLFGSLLATLRSRKNIEFW
jgi:glycosyltransferase involved in cell wall biosynthesis